MRRHLFPLVQRIVAERVPSELLPLGKLGAEIDALRTAVADAEARLAELERRTARLEQALGALPRPFHGGMTVHEAWSRHPGAPAVFARFHLPACPDCPVGADETLAEAAFGYELPLAGLLNALNALLAGGSPS